MRNVYDLENYLENKTLFIIGTGPSGESFPFRALKERYTVALNDAIELIQPTWWLLTTSLYLNVYKEVIRSGKAGTLVVKAIGVRYARKSVSGDIYVFNYKPSVARNPIRSQACRRIPWWDKKGFYLPGKHTIATVALSFASLLNVARVILVGVDYDLKKAEDGSYQMYNRNLIRRRKDISQGSLGKNLRKFKNYVRYTLQGIESGAWPIEILTTSKTLGRKLPGSVRLINEDEAIGFTE